MTSAPAGSMREVRCAIYTRKSTEEGLNQSFNSLDAQREAAQSYIRSQQNQGWRVVETAYDDGGFTGANIERPALQLLLTDIAARRVDCVVVYKVDRLSRSLLDFARLMETFDKHDVSFVSVTQQFNTASSMGRLTLNILSSFSQYERETIAERTRDKLRAARRKGKWTGGCPVLGYDVDPRGGRLLVNEAEATQVRGIFELFLEHREIEATLAETARRGWTMKSWVTRQEKVHRGGAFREDSLRRLLANRLYLGMVRQGDCDYPGEHTAIVERSCWDEAQRLLESAARAVERKRTQGASGILSGLLRCGSCGAQMAVTMCRRAGQHYRYYVCPAATGNGDDRQRCPAKPLPADALERIVMEELGGAAGEHPGELQNGIEEVRFSDTTGEARIRLKDASALTFSIERVRSRHGRIVLHRVAERAAAAPAAIPGRVPRISRLLALAFRLGQMLENGVVDDRAELARLGRVSIARVSQILNLRYLAPDIQERLLLFPHTCGNRDIVTEREIRAIATEPNWGYQRKLFGEVLQRRGGTEPAGSVPIPD